MPDPAPRPIQRVSLKDRFLGAAAAFVNPAAVKVEASQEDRRPFQPGDPLKPFLPDGTPVDPGDSTWPPRAWVPQVGRNLSTTPRQEQGHLLTPFDQLRSLAAFDLVRISITDVVNQIMGMGWSVAVKEGVIPKDLEKDEKVKREEAMQPKVQAVKDWLGLPDPLADLRFKPWLAPIVEEVLVTDALTLYPHYDRAGRFMGLEQINGATIRPLVDARGRPPLDPEEAAYHQIVYGRPETAFRLRELWYLPKNRRVDSPYGRSPTEMVLITVNLALRHQLFNLEYYASGTIPDSIYQMPKEWTDKQVRKWQEDWDAVLSGNAEARAGGVRFVPGGEGAQYVPTKSREWKYDFEEWLARVIAWAFGVSPMPIAKTVNRATAETMEQSAMESGPKPVAEFLAENVINRAITEILKIPDVTFSWGEDEAEDPAVAYQRSVALVNNGTFLRNDVRDAYNLEPIPGGDRAFVLTAMGPLFLDELDELLLEDEDEDGALEDPGQTGDGEGGDEPPEPPTPPPKGANGDGEPEEDPEAQGGPNGPTPPPQKELQQWRRVTLRKMRRGRPLGVFQARSIPAPLVSLIQRRLEKATTELDVRRAFSDPLASRRRRARRGSPAPPSSSSPSAASGGP